MEKQEQIRAIAEHYGLTRNSDFARFFGISEQAAYQQQKQGIIKYEEVYRRCPDLSPDWLLNGGEGPMLRADRIENNGNFGFGDHVRQNLHIRESESLSTARTVTSIYTRVDMRKKIDAANRAVIDHIFGGTCILGFNSVP